MLGAYMIADFRYVASPEVEDVVVELFWDNDGERMGRIKIPDMVDNAVVVWNSRIYLRCRSYRRSPMQWY